MMIPPAAGNPCAAAASLDRQLRSPDDGPADPSSDGAAPDAGPDVVVTLGQGAAPPATYDASGKFPRPPTLDDLGANAPDSLARATESVGDDDPSTSPAGDTGAAADQDTAVPA